jgi:hypothetical protein
MSRIRLALVAAGAAAVFAGAVSPIQAREPKPHYVDGGYCDADTYRNVSGHCVRRPVQADRPPQGASAKCRDGSYSFSEHHRGTCSHHGGVASWL